MVDLSNLDTHLLIEELRGRGYKTELLFCLEDVDIQLENLNDDRDEGEKIVLDEMEKENILDDVFDNMDYYIERINSDIMDKISDYE